MGRKRSAVLVVGLAVFAWIGAMAQPEGAVAACPNEERRAEQGVPALALPDCRAYELVSPGGLVPQDSSSERAHHNGVRASIHGGAITYFTTTPASGADSSGSFYLSTRGPGSWSARNVAPQNGAAALFEDECEQNVYFSADLTRNINEEGWFEGEDAARCKRIERPLVPGEPWPYRNVFLHDVSSDFYRLLNLTPEGVEPANAKFQDASEDFSRILFSEEARLTPEAPSGNNLYLWSGGEVRLVTFSPDGSPVPGELAEGAGYRSKAGTTVTGSGLAPILGAVSTDGSRVIFYSGQGLYLRLNAEMPQSVVESGECAEPDLACTVRVDASQGPGSSGGGNFWRADSEATKVLFTSDRKLTPDSTATSGKADLYEYDLASGQLSDLTVKVGEAADVRGVLAAGEDSTRLYFVANGVLAPGATPGKCRGAAAANQTCNLYHAHEGSIDFIATLSRADRETWREGEGISTVPRAKQSRMRANVSPSGRFLAFSSIQSLTGYDNRDATDGKPNRQIFLYDAEEEELNCASCIPDGGALPDDPAVNVLLGDNYGLSAPGGKAGWKINAVLDDGSVFFDTADSLLSEDVNGGRDVYRYRAGEHRLISSGTHPGHSRFLDATPSGSDVFFVTPDSLVASDNDTHNVSVYDARIGGGFLEPAPPARPCEGEACRGAIPVPSPTSAPGTAVFRGAGNPKPRGRKAHRCPRSKRRGKQRRCTPAKRGRGAARRGLANARGGAGR